MGLTIGADPELFFTNDEHLVSSIGLIGGTKQEPKDLGGGFMVLSDNVTGEFNIPPAVSPTEFVANVSKGLDNLVRIATKNKLKVSKLASATFPEKELQSPEAQEFGCEPDFDAWTIMVNQKPEADNTALRSCGGHVHIGGFDEEYRIHVVRAMDLYLGVPSILLDNDTERRKLYGKAGAHRPKDYGVEYRSLSNFWIFEEHLCDWVWKATHAATEYALNNPILEDMDIQTAINTSNKDLAMKILDKYPQVKELLPDVVV